MRSEFEETQKLISIELELTRNGREIDASEAAAQVCRTIFVTEMGILTTKHQAAKAKILHSREMDEVRMLLRDARQDLGLERQRNGLKVLELEKEVCGPERPR